MPKIIHYGTDQNLSMANENLFGNLCFCQQTQQSRQFHSFIIMIVRKIADKILVIKWIFEKFFPNLGNKI